MSNLQKQILLILSILFCTSQNSQAISFTEIFKSVKTWVTANPVKTAIGGTATLATIAAIVYNIMKSNKSEETDTLDLDDDLNEEDKLETQRPDIAQEQAKLTTIPTVVPATSTKLSGIDTNPEIGIMAGGFLGNIIAGNSSRLIIDTTTSQLTFSDKLTAAPSSNTGLGLLKNLSNYKKDGLDFIASLTKGLTNISTKEEDVIKSYVKQLETIGEAPAANTAEEALLLIKKIPSQAIVVKGKDLTFNQAISHAGYLIKQTLQEAPQASPTEIIQKTFFKLKQLTFGSNFSHERIGLIVGQILGACFVTSALPEQLFNYIVNGEQYKDLILA